MAEVLMKDGSWTFDGEVIRIVPSHQRGVHKLRHALGELVVPLVAVAGVAYEPARKGGKLRLRLREAADPFTQATSGKIPDAANPYRLLIDADLAGVAGYFAEEVRNALVVEQVPAGPSDRYLLPGPSVPVTAHGGDGTVTFDGEVVHLEWNWMADEGKRSAGARRLALQEVMRADWIPAVGLENGHVRFHVRGEPTETAPKHDPHCLMLWGFEKEARTVAPLMAAVAARLPHPSEGQRAELVPAVTGEDPDALLRRLRELGELRREGVLTEEEFAAAKQALLRRL
jgi:hypothetical protein